MYVTHIQDSYICKFLYICIKRVCYMYYQVKGEDGVSMERGWGGSNKIIHSLYSSVFSVNYTLYIGRIGVDGGRPQNQSCFTAANKKES